MYDILPPVVNPSTTQIPISPFRQQLLQHEQMLASMPEAASLGQAVEQVQDRVSILHVATAMLEQRMRQVCGFFLCVVVCSSGFAVFGG